MIYWELEETTFPDCKICSIPNYGDSRGQFTKIFQKSKLENVGFNDQIHEIYLSWSNQNTVRGLHFQTPPHDYTKAVTCLEGNVTDVIVDLRKGSPKYGTSIDLNLTGDEPQLLLIPQGFAHGFSVTSTKAVMAYLVSSEHSPDHDRGILWSSIDHDWQVNNPVLSERDRSFPPLINFVSPFTIQSVE